MRPFVYQGNALDALDSARKRGQKRALLVMATGLGKTVVSGFDLMRLLQQDPGRVLFLSHDTNINAQARKTFQKMLGKKYSHGNFNGKEKHLHHVDFLYATLQTMANHRGSFDPHEFKYVVLDEAHHGEAATYKPTLEYFQPVFFLAVTATPERGDSKDITEFFGEPVYRLGVFEALAKGYLCHVDYRLMTDDIQNLEVLDTPAGKLSISELNRTVFIPKRDEEIARIIAEKTKNIESPRVMIFCSSIEHAERMAALMPHAALLHSQLKDKKEVQRRLEAFRTGEITTVLTVDMLNEGIDVPEANVLVFLRSTSSRTIFLQQLGRGLRKMLGKASVLVLDFVANCERIEMVDWLTEGVKQELARASRDRADPGDIGRDGGSIEDAIDLHLEGAEFDERLLKLIGVIHEVRSSRGHTLDQIAGQLKALGKELGRAPSKRDIDANSPLRKCASYPSVLKAFGSLSNALHEAGFEGGKKKRYTKEEIIADLKKLAEELGATPMMSQVDQASKLGKIANASTIAKRFGGYNLAVSQAGLRPRQVTRSKEQMTLEIKALASKLGRTPVIYDVTAASKRGETADPSTYARTFGSFPAALRESGLEVSLRGQEWTRAAAIEALQSLASELGKAPSQRDIAAVRSTRAIPPSGVYVEMFGSLAVALEEAGISVPGGRSKLRLTKEQLILDLQEAARSLGHAPTSVEWPVLAKKHGYASAMTYYRKFDSWPAALEAAHLK